MPEVRFNRNCNFLGNAPQNAHSHRKWGYASPGMCTFARRALGLYKAIIQPKKEIVKYGAISHIWS